MQQQSARHPLLPWLGWFIASLAGLYQFVLQTSSGVMITDLENTFSLDTFGVSLLSSSFFYTYLLCQIPAGILIDYFKPRRTIFICQFMLGIACLLFASSSHVWCAEFSRILMGFFCAPTIVAALYLIARTLPEKYFALVLGTTETMGMLGGVVGQTLLSRSVTHLGWRYTMVILACIAFMMAILAWLLISDVVRPETNFQTDNKLERSLWRDLVLMLLEPQVWINGLFCGLTFGLVAAFASFWCIPYLMSLYHMPLSQAADASSMVFFGAAIGAPLIGWLSDQFATRRLFMLLWTFFALIIFLSILYGPSPDIIWMYGGLFSLGFFSGVYLLPFAVMRDITPLHIRGTAMGYINMMCILIGSPLLQPLIGWILHAQGVLSIAAYRHALLVIPISLLLALLLAGFVRDKPASA